LRQGPLSFRVGGTLAEGAPPPPVTALQETDPRRAAAQVQLALAGEDDLWAPVPHLLDAGPFDELFAVETDDAGRAWLRFGDGELGKAPPMEADLAALYRVGVGHPGNVGRDALVHVAAPVRLTSPLLPPPDPPPALAFVEAVRSPVPAWGGVEPEPKERVKQLAPPALHAIQVRAVTEADYARLAERHAEVDRAVATFRWTGSWLTVFVTVDRCGGREVDAAFEAELRRHLEAGRLAGYDLEVDAPEYVPLEVEIDVCADRDHFRGHVAEALADALSSRALGGNRRGFFHPDAFSFGAVFYLSELYAAVEAVSGVDSAEVTVFKRFWEVEQGELDRGYMRFGRLEVPRLDNDPSRPENGVLRLNVMGGKG
jgi:predicted phage baseplate assembly protein